MRRALTALYLLCSLPLVSGCSRPVEPGRPVPQRAVIGSPGMEPGRFAKPRCIDADERTIWVVDRAAKVQRFDPQSGLCIQYFTMPDFELGKPTGITVGPSPRGDGKPSLYLADTHYSRIVVYTIPELPKDFSIGSASTNAIRIEPEEVLRFGSFGNDDGQMVYPTDVAILTAADGKTVERLYVSEYGGHDRISAFDAKGKFLFCFGSFGDAPSPSVPAVSVAASSSGPTDAKSRGPAPSNVFPAKPDDKVVFNRPQSIAIRAIPGGQELIVTDSINHRLGVFDLDGHPKRWIGSPLAADTAPGHFNHPRGLSLLPDGTAMVIEFGNNRVQHIDLDSGRSLGLWGTGGRGDGQLAEPWGLAMLGKSAYIVDAMNHRVVVADIP